MDKGREQTDMLGEEVKENRSRRKVEGSGSEIHKGESIDKHVRWGEIFR